MSSDFLPSPPPTTPSPAQMVLSLPTFIVFNTSRLAAMDSLDTAPAVPAAARVTMDTARRDVVIAEDVGDVEVEDDKGPRRRGGCAARGE